MNVRMLLAPLGAALVLATPLVASAATPASATTTTQHTTTTTTSNSHATPSRMAPATTPAACKNLTGKQLTDCKAREARKPSHS